MSTVTYLTTPIAEARRDEPPRGSGMTREGYTKRSGAPSSLMIRLQGEKGWRRLMVWQFSNTGTMFVRIRGVEHVVRESDIPAVQEKGAASKGSTSHLGRKKSTSHVGRKKSASASSSKIMYFVQSRGVGGKVTVPVYVYGPTRRSDEGIPGYDMRVRPLRLGQGTYTMVVSPDDLEEKP